MIKLKFKNPVFNNGINYTVRHWQKWAKILNVGDRINLNDIATGRVSRIDVSYFSLINPVAWIFNHDSECRNGRQSLWNTLVKYYGVIDPLKTVVTSIEFYVGDE